MAFPAQYPFLIRSSAHRSSERAWQHRSGDRQRAPEQRARGSTAAASEHSSGSQDPEGGG